SLAPPSPSSAACSGSRKPGRRICGFERGFSIQHRSAVLTAAETMQHRGSMKFRDLRLMTRRHRGRIAIALATMAFGSLAAPLAASAQMPQCDTSRYIPAVGLNAQTTPQLLRITWNGDPGQQLQLQFDVRNRTPVIADLALRSAEGKWISVLTNAT